MEVFPLDDWQLIDVGQPGDVSGVGCERVEMSCKLTTRRSVGTVPRSFSAYSFRLGRNGLQGVSMRVTMILPKIKAAIEDGNATMSGSTDTFEL